VATITRAGTEPRAAEPLDRGRAHLLALLGRLLGAAPDAELLWQIAALPSDPTPVGRALGELAAAARATDEAALEREHFAVFVGLGRGEVLPYGSYYLTGFLHDRPLAELRGDLARLGVARAAGVSEPEDHIASELETLAGLLGGVFAAPEEAAGEFFARHLRPWAGRFFADLEAAPSARFYRAVGALGRLVMDIEQAALELPA
jgi:TorA maturation chaperone TorD